MATFVFFLVWYVFFIIAFGLGFYILLHKKPKDATTITSKNTASVDTKMACAKEDDYEFFNSPWLSLVKTSTMFVGELVSKSTFRKYPTYITKKKLFVFTLITIFIDARTNTYLLTSGIF